MPTLRLDKIIADSGMYSRSEANSLIKRGRVIVGNLPAASGAKKYDPETESVFVDGTQLKHHKYRYIMLNKPHGYVSSTNDQKDKTVLALLDDKYLKLGLFPVGRLDKDAEGLLLLTNDGGLSHRITSPAKNVSKRYYVKYDGCINDNDIEAFAQGITLGDGTKCLPALLEPAPDGAYITLTEGKYHQVKRMMAALGKPVQYLKRIAIGGLMLDENLMPGDYRELIDEISLIFTYK